MPGIWLPERPKHDPRTQVRISLPSGPGTRCRIGRVARPHNPGQLHPVGPGQGPCWGGGEGPGGSGGTPCQGVPHTPQINSSMLSNSSAARAVQIENTGQRIQHIEISPLFSLKARKRVIALSHRPQPMRRAMTVYAGLGVVRVARKRRAIPNNRGLARTLGFAASPLNRNLHPRFGF